LSAAVSGRSDRRAQAEGDQGRDKSHASSEHVASVSSNPCIPVCTGRRNRFPLREVNPVAVFTVAPTCPALRDRRACFSYSTAMADMSELFFMIISYVISGLN